MRTDRVWIPPTACRCEPQSLCHQKELCGRYLAMIPKGSPLSDYSQQPRSALGCAWILPTTMRPVREPEPVKGWPGA